jgi:hypothetical protein
MIWRKTQEDKAFFEYLLNRFNTQKGVVEVYFKGILRRKILVTE